MPRSTTATISISALAHNLAVARRHARSVFVWAVVKADAYGHGLACAVDGFDEADGLALLEFDRAIQLRALGWDRPILMLEGPFDAQDVATAAEVGLELAIHDRSQIEWLEAWRGPAVAVHLKMDSGMHRLGFAPQEMHRMYERLLALQSVRGVRPMMHFACADEAGGMQAPLERFDGVLSGAGDWSRERAGFANSAALLSWNAQGAQAGTETGARASKSGGSVRPGIMLYGASPFADRSALSLDLKPAMTLTASLIATREIDAGERVGYGGRFEATQRMRIGVVACGYADGYPRHAPTGTPIAVDGVRTRTIGRVSMDMLMVDLDAVPRAQVGSPVELWGERIPIDDVAAHAGTIGYELMCAVAPRVRRQVVA